METTKYAMPKPGVKGAKPPTRKACSSLRARRMVRWISAGNGEPGTTYFFTATFRENITDYDQALNAWRRFRRSLKKEFEDVRFIAVPEIQPRSGRWHFHAVFCGLPEESAFLDAYGWHRYESGKSVPMYKQRFTEMWSKANAHTGELGDRDRTDIQVARSVAGVCGYLAKYLCKDVGGVVPAGRRNYFSGGKGLVRPLILEGKHEIPESVPVFAVKGKDRFGNATSFARYVAA